MTGLPPDLYGRRRTDRALGALLRVTDGYERLASRFSRRGRPRPLPPPGPELRLLVDEVRAEAAEVVGLRLVSSERTVLPAWQPGCHLDVTLPSGLRRQYSLCGDPGERAAYRIAVRRIVGGAASGEVHALRPGRELVVSGPRNAFPFLPAIRYLFLAGGIGITPILPMAQAAARAGADWRVVYCGRSRASMPFLEPLRALDADRVSVRCDDEHGRTGARELLTGAGGADVYCCGPPPMIDAVRTALSGSGARSLHYERFSPPPVVDGQPFELELRRSDLLLPVAADRSALDVLRAALPDVAYSCRQGFCGTCEVRLVAGDVQHRDRVLTEQARVSAVTPCVSRARGRMVLDL